MRVWWFCALMLAAASGWAVDILDLPDQLDARYDLVWTLPAPPPAPWRLQIEQGGTLMGYDLEVTATAATWTPVAALPRPVIAPLPAGLTYPCIFTLKRRPGAVALLCNHRMLFTAPMPTPVSGTLRLPESPATKGMEAPRYQPVDPPCFGDDFMRPEALERLVESQLCWVEDTVWRVESINGDAPGKRADGANAATLQMNPWQLSLFPVAKTTTNGFWFLYTGVGPSWVAATPVLCSPRLDRYAVQAAVRPEYDSTVGLLAAYQDPRNHLLLRWHQQGATPGMELLALIDGTPRVLATGARGFRPGQWYTLRLNVGWRRVQALVDGQVVLEATNPGSIEGRVGLYADAVAQPKRPTLDARTAMMYAAVDKNTGQVKHDPDVALAAIRSIYFDDVRVGPWEADTLDNAPDTLLLPSSHWTKMAGMVTATAAPARAVFGPAGGRLTVSARVRLPAEGEGGLAVEGTGGSYAWVLTPRGSTLAAMTMGKPGAPVAESTAPIVAEAWHDARLVLDGRYLCGWLDGRRVLDAVLPMPAAGRGGVLALTPGVAFADVSVIPAETPPSLAVHAGFAQDKYLCAWASAEADWYPAVLPATLATPAGVPLLEAGAAAPLPTDRPGWYWYKGGVYGDIAVAVPLAKDHVAGQTLAFARAYDAATGYRLALDAAQVRLYRRDILVAQAPLAVKGPAQLVCRRQGTWVSAEVQTLSPDSDPTAPVVTGVTPLLAYHDPLPLTADTVGWCVSDHGVPAARLRVSSARIQEAFEEAPAGWLVQSGLWSVMARYSCSPQWNWFGGFGGGVPAIWSKARLDGDQTVEAYLGIKMRSNEDHDEYAQRYRDLGVTLCGDGADVLHGYAVLRGTRLDGQPVTQLLRNGVVVASSTAPAHLFPPDVGGHRHWFATRVEKRGGEVRVYLDNLPALTYTDPDPLPGGRVALWTRDNGMMVGRVNLGAEDVRLVP
jgi:hypothetical protein